MRRVQQARLEAMRAAGHPALLAHVTRMTPRRADELLDGGSLYWVIRGQVLVRQQLLDIVRFTDEQGTGRCKLVLEPELVPVRPQPRRAFQGWRYLKPEDCPQDIAPGEKFITEMPPEMRASLMEMGLL